MNAQAILQKIEDDARVAAQQLTTDAEKKAVELTAAAEEKAKALHDELTKQAKAEGEAMADRMGRMAELDMRKQLLQRKRQLMDEAFQQAGQALCGQPTQATRAFLLTQLAGAAQGDEQLLIGANNDGWFDDRFLAELAQSGKKLTLADGRREGVTGAVLLRGGTEVLVTYESMLDNARTLLETDIAKILFNE